MTCPYEFTDSIEDILAQLEENEAGCLIWPYGTGDYGRVRLPGGGPNIGVHKLAWTFVNGPVPAGRELHHGCEIKRCANVEHLEALTRLEHKARHKPKERSLKGSAERSGTDARHRKSLNIDDDLYAQVVECAWEDRASVNMESLRALAYWVSLSKEDRAKVLLTLPVRRGW